MKKKHIILISVIGAVIILGGVSLLIWKKSTNKLNNPKQTKDLTIVPTMQDIITSDSIWTGTFQLVWNDLIKEVVKKDVIFSPQELMVTNLNKQEFTTEMISDTYYYKKYGFKTLELKKEIEEAIREKFNQKSDILDKFDWSKEALNDANNPNIDRYFFYVMLYRKFEYLYEFNKLDNGAFGKHNDIEYFGINNSSNDEVRKQMDVLYYNSLEDFAILINTITNDEVILYKNPKGNTFKEIYNNLNNEIDKYKGNKILSEHDEFKAPILHFNELREYDELSNKIFLTADGREGEIIKALQTIQFSLDEKGGEIKSEAGMDVNTMSAAPDENSSRNFYLDNTFAIFLREKGQTMPYFASRIDDITKFQ